MAVRYNSKSTVYLDSNGKPRAGGKLNFYTTGTSTPKNTYTVDALTVGLENTNPVVLNSSGRSATDIFLSAADYKVVLTNSDGTDSITDDPVHGGISVAVNELRALGGSTPTMTTSATKVMMGLGSSWVLTPSGTGRVRITVCGYTTNSLLGNVKINAYFGIGTAPINGAALTGTAFNSTDMLATSANSGLSPANDFALISEAVSLTLGTAYWFDIALGSSSGNSAVTINAVIIEEIR